jgi:hypothetical protein
MSFVILTFALLHLFTRIIWFFFEGSSTAAHGLASSSCPRGGIASYSGDSSLEGEMGCYGSEKGRRDSGSTFY